MSLTIHNLHHSSVPLMEISSFLLAFHSLIHSITLMLTTPVFRARLLKVIFFKCMKMINTIAFVEYVIKWQKKVDRKKRMIVFFTFVSESYLNYIHPLLTDKNTQMLHLESTFTTRAVAQSSSNFSSNTSNFWMTQVSLKFSLKLFTLFTARMHLLNQMIVYYYFQGKLFRLQM